MNRQQFRRIRSEYRAQTARAHRADRLAYKVSDLIRRDEWLDAQALTRREEAAVLARRAAPMRNRIDMELDRWHGALARVSTDMRLSPDGRAIVDQELRAAGRRKVRQLGAVRRCYRALTKVYMARGEYEFGDRTENVLKALGYSVATAETELRHAA